MRLEFTAYEYLMGKSRGEIISELGIKSNNYCHQVWIYRFKKDLFGRWMMLILVFEENKVKSIFLKKPYYIPSNG